MVQVLSRAFRNRFIELHFDEIPSLELETIMHLRCDMPPSYCKKMVAVMSDLQVSFSNYHLLSGNVRGTLSFTSLNLALSGS